MQIQLGDKGQAVKAIQTRLSVAVSGTFDIATDSAVCAYQTAESLTVTGVVDLTTWHRLFPTDQAIVAQVDTRGTFGAGDEAKIPTTKAVVTYVGTAGGAFQPLNANLTALAGQTGAADRLSYWTAAATLALATFTSFGRTLLALADYAALKAGLSLDNVTNVAQLPASYLDTDGTLAANSDTRVASQKATKTYADGKIPKSAFTAADKLLYSTAASTYAETGLTSSWRGALADTTSMAWDATNKVMTFGPNDSITGLIIRATGSGTPDPVNAGACLILAGGANNFLKICTTGTGVGANDGLLVGINGTTVLVLIREDYDQDYYSNGSIKWRVGKDGSPCTAYVGLAVSDLTANEGVYAGTGGRLTRTRRLQIYATGTTNGTAGTSVNLTAAALGTSGDLRLIRLMVKAKGANVPPAKFARSLECFWGNAAGTLTQTGTDTLGTLYSSGSLAGGTIVSAASGTNVVITCTDVTGVGATVTWEIFGEYM